jgi:hypothetical protein
MTHKELAEKMRDYILTQESVTQEQLLERGKGRFDTGDMLRALAIVNRMYEIQHKVKGNDVLYQKRVEKKPTTALSWRVEVDSATQKEWDKLLDDHFIHSPLATEEEYVCYKNKWRGERCRELASTPGEKQLQHLRKR